MTAWEDVVKGEDAAIYAYGLAGARLTGTARERAMRARGDHEVSRAHAAQIVTASAGTVPEPAVAYDSGDTPQDAQQSRALLARVELALVPIYAQAAGTSTGADRGYAARSAAACASRATTWGATPEAFPD